ncbi:MAG TPA: hydroxymethylbilane synthase [Hanamia sp.]|jgi:hydroxymethylbilane synthase|nr:hydroxymethylbilane synthase [Hanamia sp.]
MKRHLKIGTRESELAVWQASHVQKLLKEIGVDSELIFIKSEGDIDTKTPLYELGVQGIFTKTLDVALLNNRIDIAVHSMKDVPTQPALGIRLAAVLKRASYKDILVFRGDKNYIEDKLNNFQHSTFKNQFSSLTIATSSIRRKAQWLNRYPDDTIVNLRGNVNTRLRKLEENNWNGAIFAAAGLERIHLRPENSIDLDWMLPAPAQGAITVSCREHDVEAFEAVNSLNDEATQKCTKIERDFLRTLLGGCSTPISALAVLENDKIVFRGNVCSIDGKEKFDIRKEAAIENFMDLGITAAEELLQNDAAKKIIYSIRNAK